MRLTGLGEIDGALGGAGQRGLVDLEARDLRTQHRILEPAQFVGADGVGGNLPERPADAALAHARDHGALVLQQIFARRPSRD